MDAMAHDLFQQVLSLLQTYPYLFIFVGMLVAGEVVLLPAIYLAATGRLDLAAVISLAILATVLSDLFWYGLGRKFPASALDRIPGHHSNNAVRGLERLFNRKGVQILFLSKFVYGTRTAAQVLAGVHDMRFRTYVIVNFLAVLTRAHASILGLGKSSWSMMALRMRRPRSQSPRVPASSVWLETRARRPHWMQACVRRNLTSCYFSTLT